MMKFKRIVVLFLTVFASQTFANNYISANVEHAFRSSKLQTIHTKYLVRWDDYELLLEDRGDDFNDPDYYDSSNSQVETLVKPEQGLGYVSDDSSTSISPVGRYITFATEPSRSTADPRLRTNELYLYDRSLGSIIQISSSEDSGNFRYNRPSVSDNGYVSYHRTPIGLTVERTERKVFLYDPATENTTMLGVECGYSLTIPPQDIKRYSLGGKNSDISGDGRYVVFQQFCYEANSAGGPDVDTYQTYLYDHVLETTIALGEVSDGHHPVQISIGGRFVTYSLGKLYDQLNGFMSSGRVDCIDLDGDGWGTVEASNASCLVEDFESEYAGCDYIDLVSGGYNLSAGEICRFTKADSQSVTADNCVLGGESRNGFCRYPYTTNAFEFVRNYNNSVASDTTQPAPIVINVPGTQQESIDSVIVSTDSDSEMETGDAGTAAVDSESVDSTASTDDSGLPTRESESGGGIFLELLLLVALVFKNRAIKKNRSY